MIIALPNGANLTVGIVSTCIGSNVLSSRDLRIRTGFDKYGICSRVERSTYTFSGIGQSSGRNYSGSELMHFIFVPQCPQCLAAIVIEFTNFLKK